MRTILYYLNVKHIRINWPKIFKIILMFFLRIISNPFKSPVVQLLPMKGCPPSKMPASIAQDPSCALRNWQALSDRISSTMWQ